MSLVQGCILFLTDLQSVTVDERLVPKYRSITLSRRVTGARSRLPYLNKQQQDGQQM